MAIIMMNKIKNGEFRSRMLRVSPLYKNDEKFGLNENYICIYQINFQQICKVLINISASLGLMYKLLQMVLQLWIHPRPYII
jgi:hypothetical protein